MLQGSILNECTLLEVVLTLNSRASKFVLYFLSMRVEIPNFAYFFEKTIWPKRNKL